MIGVSGLWGPMVATTSDTFGKRRNNLWLGMGKGGNLATKNSRKRENSIFSFCERPCSLLNAVLCSVLFELLFPLGFAVYSLPVLVMQTFFCHENVWYAKISFVSQWLPGQALDSSLRSSGRNGSNGIEHLQSEIALFCSAPAL